LRPSIQKISLKKEIDENCAVVYLDITQFAKGKKFEDWKKELAAVKLSPHLPAKKIVVQRTTDKVLLACLYKKGVDC